MQGAVSSEAFHAFWAQQQRVFTDERQRCAGVAYALEKAGCDSVQSCSWAEWGAAWGTCGEGWPPSCCLPEGARDPGRADAAAPLLCRSETPPPQRMSPPWEDQDVESESHFTSCSSNQKPHRCFSSKSSFRDSISCESSDTGFNVLFVASSSQFCNLFTFKIYLNHTFSTCFAWVFPDVLCAIKSITQTLNCHI